MTIYDIAKEAQTSISTVSRFLNGKPIRQKTAIRIQQIIEKYNYSPSTIARGLVSKSLKTIAIVMPDIRIFHYAEMAYVIEQAFIEKGYNTFISNFPLNLTKGKELIRMLISRNVDAFVFISSFMEIINQSPKMLKMLENIPVVSENSTLDLPNSISVIFDDGEGIRMACNYLINKKQKKKIYYVQDTISASAEIKKKAFMDYYIKYDLDVNSHIYITERNPKAGYDALKQILNDHPDAEAVIFEEEVTAFGGIKACSDLGLLAGRDIDIIGYNRSQYGDVCNPELTYVDTKDYLQGQKIVEAIEELFAQPYGGKKKIVVKPEFVIKESA